MAIISQTERKCLPDAGRPEAMELMGQQATAVLLRNRLYYSLKPFIPQTLRMGMRRWMAMRARPHVKDVWPIYPGSECKPAGWRGWPEGKKFAIVFTHDVESQAGVDKCEKLLNLEKQYGFRSSFNFIPEGPYDTPLSLRAELQVNGFEVGIHDLRHDGRLFNSRARFRRSAKRINRYMEDWGAVGFRAGFMLHELNWLHDLGIEYDLSTFDTDPFEPQPQGRRTIFPFWIPAGLERDRGYVEMPYTLPQDSTLFLLLREEGPRIWLEKLDWIVANGGMALVNIHPDYIRSPGERPSSLTYPVDFLTQFFNYVRTRYAGQYWNPCPRELARWYRGERAGSAGETSFPVAPLPAERKLHGKSAAVLLYSFYPADPRPRRAAEALVEAGMDVDLFCLRETSTEPEQETVHGVRVHRLPIRKKRGTKWDYLLQYSRFLWHSFWFLVSRGVGERYDLVHVHNMPDVLVFAALAPKLRGAAVVLDLHDPMPELMMSIYGMAAHHPVVRLLRTLERWSIGFADLAFTPNITFKDLFVTRSCPPVKMEIIMNSPEEEIFRGDTGPCEDAASLASGEDFRVMHHGSIVHRHGIDLLVLAIARLRDRIPGIRLDIYGSRTPFLDDVLATAQENGVPDRVHYHGQKSQAEIAVAIRECQVGVVPNRLSPFTELNFPTRLFEYLSMHRPVVAPATRGILDYFGPGELVTFAPDDVEELASQIQWVYEHPTEVREIVERGRQLYRRCQWSGEKARLIDCVTNLVVPRGQVPEQTVEAVPLDVPEPSIAEKTVSELHH